MTDRPHPQLDLVLGLYGRDGRWPVQPVLEPAAHRAEALRSLDRLAALRQHCPCCLPPVSGISSSAGNEARRLQRVARRLAN